MGLRTGVGRAVSLAVGASALVVFVFPYSLWSQGVQSGPGEFRVQGVLVSAEDQAPIAGAVVRLTDMNGTQLDATISTSDGEFRMEASRPGSFLVQVSRLGFRPWFSERLDVGRNQTLTLQLQVPVLPISLPDLDVRSDRLCEIPIQQARQAFFLYEEARPILSAIADAERSGQYRYQVQVVIETSHRGRAVFDTTVAFVPTPVSTASPGELAADGYLLAPTDSTRLYLAPTAGVLASDEFEATHCFGIAVDHEGQRLGLTFTPVPGRTVADVEGVLWYSLVDMRPTTLEFVYTEVRVFLEQYEFRPLLDYVRSRVAAEDKGRIIAVGQVQLSGEFGGRLRFERLPNDLWITREWEMHFPTLAPRISWRSGGGTRRPRVEVMAWAKPRTKSTRVLAVLSSQRNQEDR